jgi:hypothetical protein
MIMMINISNYPSDRWSEAQKEAAREFFSNREVCSYYPVFFIEDWELPNIPPNATEKEVAELVDKYYQRVLALDFWPRAIHVMGGEMDFTFSLVSRLSAAGYRVVASTTELEVVEHEGVKTYRHRFVRFRDYVRW